MGESPHNAPQPRKADKMKDRNLISDSLYDTGGQGLQCEETYRELRWLRVAHRFAVLCAGKGARTGVCPSMAFTVEAAYYLDSWML